MSSTATADNGVQLPLSDLNQVFTFSGSFISTITVVYRTLTYIQTFTNNGTNITNISPWIKQ